MTRVGRPGPEVAVTGLGAVSAAGIGVEANWQRVCEGVSAAALDPALDRFGANISCRVPAFDVTALVGSQGRKRSDRTTQLGLLAAREAIADAGLSPGTWDGARVGIVMGTSGGAATSYETEYVRYVEEGPEWVSPLFGITGPMNLLAGFLAIALRAFGPNMVVTTACAAGPTAIGTARHLLQADMCDVVLAGGAEAPLTGMLMSSLVQMGAVSRRVHDPAGASRPFDADRDGMVAAEGAGVLVLERARDAAARGARRRALVAGYGASADGYHLSAPDPEGLGAERAIRQALAEAGLTGADIDHVNAHGSSTPLNDVTEAAVIERLYAAPAVTSTKGVVGHALGAAGALEAVYTVLALEHGLVPPTANLSRQDPRITVDVVAGKPREAAIRAATTHSFGFGGQNAVLAFVRP
ncbi:beta-ketoacyl-[acyl-carrier-protein] synthase family protein [Streptomyces hoynatensis]|uniref:Beta-ketoacyl-[acyl-carrier-protein] synthase family protein n=1 Tax=Streptomyces hoynatensis TaxID=1141874 RepID=A0A3A9ZH46_9ACTN|nr:beta-ketoacyl-[acyl-carrier-protein] synthase family protein [Streptomyces hoynatensis]RKN47024.1 beta-ketoacyl-[acyl-carrier-protein] synthase family protein [Streptomyces hoynatensis]